MKKNKENESEIKKKCVVWFDGIRRERKKIIIILVTKNMLISSLNSHVKFWTKNEWQICKDLSVISF